MKRILITGCAGFIGFHLAQALSRRGDFVVGLDNFNPYYDVALKEARARRLAIPFTRGDIRNQTLLTQLLSLHGITHVVHLAAQAGVRHSLQYPEEYTASNIDGFLSVLEACRRVPQLKLTFASSSSVYGLNQKIPFSVDDPTDRPANFYGATKKANEVMAFAYHHIYGLAVTGLRFFTAYGPWGRPDMAYFRFSEQITQGEPISLFNHGEMRRDFTYIDDIVRGILLAVDLGAPHALFNLGNHRPISLLHFVELLEKALGKTAIRQLLPMQPGEVLETYADIEHTRRTLNWEPEISIEEGLLRFTHWYKSEWQQVKTPKSNLPSCNTM